MHIYIYIVYHTNHESTTPCRTLESRDTKVGIYTHIYLAFIHTQVYIHTQVLSEKYDTLVSGIHEMKVANPTPMMIAPVTLRFMRTPLCV